MHCVSLQWLGFFTEFLREGGLGSLGCLGVQFLDEVVDMRVIMHVVFFVLQPEEVPQLQYLDLAVDDFFVKFTEAVDVPVIIQRRGVRRHPCRGGNAQQTTTIIQSGRHLLLNPDANARKNNFFFKKKEKRKKKKKKKKKEHDRK